jgi:hypothetical protein
MGDRFAEGPVQLETEINAVMSELMGGANGLHLE